MTKKMITVAVVEDEQGIAHRTKWFIWKTFKRELQVLIAGTYKDAAEMIENGLADIYIIDIGLPDGDGENLIIMIREKSFYTPIIVQSTKDDMKYRLKVLDEYDRIKYLTKEVMFEGLVKGLAWARREVKNTQLHQIWIPRRGTTESVNMYEVCYVERIRNEQNLHIELYDFDSRAYKSKERKNMSLDKFMQAHNELGLFLRCHSSFIVNKKMIEEIRQGDSELLMQFRGDRDVEIRVPIGPTYKKSVIAELRGL